MILYPTETVYGLGVNALDKNELDKLYALKGRGTEKSVLWLVRDFEDVKQYAEVEDVAAKIARRFLPGPLTLVLPLKDEVLQKHAFLGPTIGFRVSSDHTAQKLVAEFMAEHNVPLTSTSANLSGQPTMPTVSEILAQFGEKKKEINTIIDDGPRDGLPSTVIEIKNQDIIIHREGSVPSEDIYGAV